MKNLNSSLDDYKVVDVKAIEAKSVNELVHLLNPSTYRHYAQGARRGRWILGLRPSGNRFFLKTLQTIRNTRTTYIVVHLGISDQHLTQVTLTHQ